MLPEDTAVMPNKPRVWILPMLAVVLLVLVGVSSRNGLGVPAPIQCKVFKHRIVPAIHPG